MGPVLLVHSFKLGSNTIKRRQRVGLVWLALASDLSIAMAYFALLFDRGDLAMQALANVTAFALPVV
jgi:hypothetical protein